MKNATVKRLRLYYGLTQSQFAEKLGVSKSAIARIETGSLAVTDRIRFALARNFEITNELLEGLERAERLKEF